MGMDPILWPVLAGANKIDMFAFFPAQSFGMALTTYVGQNIGAGKMHRVKEGLRATMVMSVLCGIGAMALVLVYGPNMMRLFSQEAAVIEAGMDYLLPGYVLLFTVCGDEYRPVRAARCGRHGVPNDYQPFVLVDYPAADGLPAGVFLWKRVSLFQLWRRWLNRYGHGDQLLFFWPVEKESGGFPAGGRRVAGKI